MRSNRQMRRWISAALCLLLTFSVLAGTLPTARAEAVSANTKEVVLNSMDSAAASGTMHATLIDALRAPFHTHERASSADCSASAAAFFLSKHAQASFHRERAATAPLGMCPVGHHHSPVDAGCCRRIPVRAHQEAHVHVRICWTCQLSWRTRSPLQCLVRQSMSFVVLSSMS